MKTKELIRQLQEADPSGEIEVCCGNEDIHFVETLEAYYDGKLQVLKRDPSKTCYNIIGAKVTTRGCKVQIHSHSIRDAISNNPDLPIEYDLEDYMIPEYKKSYDEWREEVKSIKEEVQKEFDAMSEKLSIVETKKVYPVIKNKETEVHQSKYGFHPCSVETCRKLKKINKAFEQGLHQHSAWVRWMNKKPHNRIVRAWKRNEKGQRIGFDIVGNSVEPVINNLMKSLLKTVPAWAKIMPQYCRSGVLDITKEYRNARMPVSSPDQVKPLSITNEQIDNFLSLIDQ